MPSSECISLSLKLDMNVLPDWENLNWERERKKKKQLYLRAPPRILEIQLFIFGFTNLQKRNTSIRMKVHQKWFSFTFCSKAWRESSWKGIAVPKALTMKSWKLNKSYGKTLAYVSSNNQRACKIDLTNAKWKSYNHMP